MAHNAYLATRPGNNWALSSAFLTVEITTLALQVYQSLNADLGGTWAPSSVITIGGSGLTVTGPANLPDLESFVSDGASSFTNSGGVTFYDSSICAFVETSILSLGGDSQLQVGGASVMTVATTERVDWSSGVDFTIGSHNYSNNSIDGPYTRTGKTTYLGTNGRVQVRQAAYSDVNLTVGVEIDTLIYLQTNGVNHGLTLRATTGVAATAGERLRVIWRRTPSTAGTLLVSCETAGTLIDFGVGGTSAAIEDNACGADFEFDGTQWRVATKWGDTASVVGLVSP